MTNRYLVIIDNVVSNVVLYEGGNWNPPKGSIFMPVSEDILEVGTGWTYDPNTKKFSPPIIEESNIVETEALTSAITIESKGI